MFKRLQLAAEHKPRWVAALLAIATFLLFSPALRYDYVDYDDGVYVYANKDVLKGFSDASLRYAFTSIAGGSWMPLTWFSHMFDVEVFGPGPAGPHGMNLFLHSLSAGLFLIVLHRMTGRLWPSAFVAAVFAFHPLRNESVVWISERKDVLSTLLLMLGLLAYLRYLELPGRKRYLTVAICLLLGLMAKPMLVTFPFLLLLLDFWPLNRLGHDWQSLRGHLGPRLREKLPLIGIVLVFCGATYWAQSRYGAVSAEQDSPMTRISQVAGNYAFYMKKVFFPSGLNAIHPPHTTSPATAAMIGLLLAGVTVIAGKLAFKRPWLIVGWFWFLGMLVPVVGLVRIGHISVAERYAYVPSVGLTLIVAWQFAFMAHNKPWLQRVGICLGALVVTACAWGTRMDLPRWKDSLALFTAAIAVDPHPVSYNNIAVVHLDRGEYELAIEPLTRAIALDPRYVKAYINRITAYQKTGRSDAARGDLIELVKVAPRNAEGYNSRADILMDLGRLDEAIADFSAAIKLAPTAPNSYNNRASARFLKGDYAGAAADGRKAIELNPRYANAYSTLGSICNRTGDFSGALNYYAKALALAPGDALIYNNRAAVYYGLKRYEEARADLQTCKALGGSPHAGLVQALLQVAPPANP